MISQIQENVNERFIYLSSRTEKYIRKISILFKFFQKQ